MIRMDVATPSSTLVRDLRALGLLPGQVLLVHSSFRALRPVEGGPLGVIAALAEVLGPEGTLAMPAWADDDEVPFDPRTSPCSALGVVADTFWREPGVVRSNHLNAFAARGPKAKEINVDPLPLPPHIARSPVGRIHELDGWVLLLGVGHDANTTVHFAELMAQVPYGIPRHCTVVEAGVVRRVEYRENDHCCARFALLDEWLRAPKLQREGRVGRAQARLMRAKDIVKVARDRLADDPTIFLHPNRSGCAECDEAWASIAL
jgi:aminoglycoside N3'-acetyltransferase